MPRPRRRNQTATCYMCERKYQTKEHVPPKTFFPEVGEVATGINYRRNLITVPSCELHNLEKSDDDQYLLFIIVSSFRASELAQQIFSQKIIRAINRRPLLASFYKDNFKAFIGNRETMGYQVDRKRFDLAISRIASALYFHDYKEKWVDNYFVFSPDIFSVDSNAAIVNKTIAELENTMGQYMSSLDFLGENPEIFRYKILRKDNYLIVRMLFYQGVIVNAFSDHYRKVTSESSLPAQAPPRST